MSCGIRAGADSGGGDSLRNLSSVRTLGMKGFFVCIMGIDGSGKTTLARNLIRRMGGRGVVFTYVWGKFESLLLILLIKIKNMFLIREKDWNKNYQRSRTLRRRIWAVPFLRAVYEGYIWFVYRGRIYFQIHLPISFGRNILCDRYIYDTLVDLSLDLAYSEEAVAGRLREIQTRFPMPDLILYVDTPPKTGFSRKRDIPSLQWLEEKAAQYRRLVRYLDISAISGELPPNELADEAQGRILEQMAKRKK
jgi:thymidylate kinase